ncbi:MAG: hypothetical protein FJ303_01620 [Planctomycetes bacterium]|nr:hypothetical protein [Planctomycetota bacterium]
MAWFVDNATVLYILLGVIAAALAWVWWTNRQSQYLWYTGIPIALIAVLFLVSRFYITDAQQLENNINAMTDAVMAGKTDDLFKHISRDFRYHALSRDDLYAAARKQIEARRVTDLTVKKFKAEEISREKKRATTSFHISGTGGGYNFWYRVETDFVLEPDGWKLKTMRFYNPVVDQDKEIRLPGI